MLSLGEIPLLRGITAGAIAGGGVEHGKLAPRSAQVHVALWHELLQRLRRACFGILEQEFYFPITGVAPQLGGLWSSWTNARSGSGRARSYRGWAY